MVGWQLGIYVVKPLGIYVVCHPQRLAGFGGFPTIFGHTDSFSAGFIAMILPLNSSNVH